MSSEKERSTRRVVTAWILLTMTTFFWGGTTALWLRSRSEAAAWKMMAISNLGQPTVPPNGGYEVWSCIGVHCLLVPIEGERNEASRPNYYTLAQNPGEVTFGQFVFVKDGKASVLLRNTNR
jgi:hypothetical protein